MDIAAKPSSPTGFVPGCFSCEMNARTDLPPRESIWRSDHWRVAHAFNSGLPGWLVMVSLVHVESFSQLSEEACLDFAKLRLRLARALQKVTGCQKTYTAEFGEAEGFAHLHIHVIPRYVDQPTHLRGPRIFAYLTDKYPAVAEGAMDDLANKLSRELSMSKR